jgi:opacity protein-like surface antigen
MITAKIAVVAAVLALAAMATAAVADASWTMTQRQAVSYTKQAAHQEYGVNRYRTGAVCSPKGTSQSRQDFWPGRYHSWICGYAIRYDTWCGGRLSIKGTTSSIYAFHYVVINGFRCD